MKRKVRLAALLLCLALLLPLAACGEDEVADVDLDQVWARMEEELSGQIPQMMEVEEEQMLQLYGLSEDDLEDYELHMSMMNVQADEVFLAKVKPGRMDAVREGIESRAKALDEQWATYLPEQHELVKNYILEEKGDYVVFLIGTQADKMKTIWEESFQQS